MGVSSDELSRRARLGHRLLLQPDAVGPGLLSLVQSLGGASRRQDRDDSSSTTSGREFFERTRRIYICGYRLARRMADLKTITDTVHGTIRLDPLTLDLLETLELQRLNSIRQLGLTYLVFPGANHSRVEHCLGVGHVAGEMARALGLSDDERKLVQAAGLLHDVGHGPFSHTLEHVLSRELAVDHMHLTQRIITGHDDNVSPEDRRAFPDVKRIHEVLETHRVDPEAVAALIRGPSEKGAGLLVPGSRKETKRYLAQIIHSPMDADQIDYLMRDAHYTGATHGTIDFSRLLQTLRTHRGELALDRKGLPALEGMLVARGLIYSSVYFHKSARIAEAEVPIVNDGNVRQFSKVSPLGRALQGRQVVDWVVMVAAPAEAVDAVRKASMSALFG